MRPQEIGIAERTEEILAAPPMTIRGHSDFEDRQLMLFGTATIVLLVIAWTFAYLASRAV
jgi:CHASE1-domain containing sensor protein